MTKKTTLLCAYLVFFIDNVGISLVYPLFASLLLNSSYGILSEALSINTKNILLGLLIGAFPFAQFFGAPFFGDIADYKGRRNTFFYTILGVTMGYTFTALSLLFKSYVFLFASRLWTGFFSGNWSVSFATVADLTPDKKIRAKRFALISSLGGIGWIVAMIVGGDLSNPQLLKIFNPSIPFWITAFLSLISLIAVIFFFGETLSSPRKGTPDILKGIHHLKMALDAKGIRILFISFFIFIMGWILALGWASAVMLERYKSTQSLNSWVLIGMGVIWSLFSLPVNRLLIRYRPQFWILGLGMSLASIGLFFAGVSSLLWLYIVLFFLGAAGSALVWSNMMNLISISAPQKLQGVTMGIGQSVLSAGQVCAPLLGILLALISVDAIYLVAGILALIAFLLVNLKGNKRTAP